MARWYVLQGPHATREQAEGAYAAMDRNHTRLRVAKLRDRTGPSLRERVAELEAAEKDAAGRAGASLREIGDRVIAMCDSRLVDMGKRLAALESALGEPVCVGCGGSIGHHHAPDQGGCSGWFPTVREHLARVETEHRAAVERIGDLEREPSVAEERESDDDAPVRPEESVAANPGWLAKVPPEPTDAGRALYNLGREHGRADADAAIDLLRGKLADMRVRAEKAEAERDAARTGRDKAEDFLARIANGARAISTAELLPGDIALARAEGRMFVCTDGSGCVLVPVPEEPIAAPRDPLADPQPGDWFVDTLDEPVVTEVLPGGRTRRFYVNGRTLEHGLPWSYYMHDATRPMTPAEIAAFKRDGTRPGAPTPTAPEPIAHVPTESSGADGARLALSEADMAAELREAGWTPSAMTGRWYLPIGSAGGDGGRVIADAHAAMCAAKGAR